MERFQCKRFSIKRSEFSRNFIQIEEELKMHIVQTKLKLAAEEKNRNEFLNMAHQFKNEKLIEENLADNARLKVEIDHAVFNKPNSRLTNIFIKLTYGTEPKQTSVLTDRNNLVWNERFEL